MKKQIKNKIAQIFYRSPKEINGARVSTSLSKFEKEIGKAMNDVFREDKKKVKKKDKDGAKDKEE